jgi:2'-5' RNA ligase
MRVFVAIDLADNVRQRLTSEQAQLRVKCGRSRGIHWTRPEGWHLTLKFLGEIEPEQVKAVAAALVALPPFPAFEIDVKGFGFFPDARRPRVFWAGLDAPPALAELAGRVESALEPLGFERETRPFRPHLTLARLDGLDPILEAAVPLLPRTSLGRFEVREYFLFESRLYPGGAEYKKQARVPGDA